MDSAPVAPVMKLVLGRMMLRQLRPPSKEVYATPPLSLRWVRVLKNR